MEEHRGGSGPLAPEQMACRKPIDKKRGVKGEKGGSVQTGLQLKGRLVWFALPPKKQSHNTPVQVTAEGNRVCRLGLYLGMPFSHSYPEPCFG